MKVFNFSKSYALGLVFIFCVAAIWSGASILVQYIFDNLDFRSPFLVTYICNTLFIIYLPLWQFWVWLKWIKDPPPFSKENVNSKASEDSSGHGLVNHSESDNHKSSYCHMDVIKAAIIISPLWFISNCLYNYSLYMTSVTSSTIISNLSSAFTLTFAYFVKLEDITVGKILGIVFCFGGAVFVALQDRGDNDGTRTISGDIVALLSAIGYGMYTTAIRRIVPDDEGISMQLLLGYIGVINGIIAFPALLVMIILNFENIRSVSGEVIGFIMANGLCDNVLSDYLWARAVVLTSPTVATLGSSITIPLAIISDLSMGKGNFTYMSACGAIFVIIGFTLVNIDNDIWTYFLVKLGLQRENAVSKFKNVDYNVC